MNDLLSILKSGKIRRKGKLDIETNEYLYRIETAKIAVVLKFREY